VRDESAVQVRLNELNQQSTFEVRPHTRRSGRPFGSTIKGWLAHFGSFFHLAGTSLSAERLKFIRAGIYAPNASSFMTGSRLLLMTVPVTLALLAATVYGVDCRLAIILGAPAGIAGMVLPALWLRRKTNKRKTCLRRALPDFLDVMVVCLESGMSFESSLQRCTEELQEAHATLATELGIVQREITLGKPVEKALENFAFRADLKMIKILATNVQQSRKLGIRIADNLRTHADMLRTKRENRAEERAQKAAITILMPTLLFIFPAILVVLVGPAVFQIRENLSAQSETQMTIVDSR
jgi:tight adherence protein C